MNLRISLLFALILSLSFFLYFPIFSIYFFQDDFFLFSISHVNNIFDILNFFIPRSDVQFYRPLGAEVLFWILRSVFGWNPIYYHLIIWIFFILIICLVFKISKLITYSNRKALVISLLYSTSAIHYNSLAWLSNSAYIIGTLFFFLSIYLIFSIKNHILFFIFSYILGLLTFEFAIILPFIIFVGDKLNIFKLIHKKNLYLSLFLVSGFYYFFRFILFHPDSSSYHFEINRSVISSYRFFTLFLLNWPETMKDNFLKFWLIRPGFVSMFRIEINIWMINTFLVGIYGAVVTLYRHKERLNSFLFLGCWFVLGLLPIIFIPSHIAPHYGSISLLPFLMIFFDLPIKKMKKRFYSGFLMVIIVFWVYSSNLTIKFNQNYHWIKYRSDIARHWISYFKSNERNIREKSLVKIKTNDKEVKIALFEEKAVQEFLSDHNIHTYYQELD